ncbi:hypothetical protein M3204_13740 [Mesobacillus subterraneus]|uniref:hypothetical protein n=1 Tax=Mesobacillus subterraneus TaxID=285983 RepID=UPI00203E9967|nr:hypothetical protein [Mesobacillus subterraneus]MCM3665474.1 hypothetical protein [Mesobacillus subterraneus]MCM3684519.1 hypothetical protein [Mesobacillus subterraneus]
MDFSIVLLIVMCFFLLIVPFRYILKVFTNKEISCAYKVANLTGLAVLSLLIVIGIDVLTIDPQTISGNGNLALLLIIPFIMVLTLYLTAFFLFFKEVINRRWKLLLSIILPLIIIFSLARIWQDSSELISLLGGGPKNPDSRIYRFPWLNQYTNTIFFNVYLIVLLSGLTMWGSAVFTSKKS